MAELLKNRFNYELVNDLALRIKAVYPAFRADAFVGEVIDESWQAQELKARMRRIAVALGKHLPARYEQALGILDRVVLGYPEGYNDFALMFFPEFVAVYGQEEGHWDLSMAALERYTPSSTAEFAVRPFIIHNQERMMKQMAAWAGHENHHVRRLASEGCRPALPWGQALASFKADPSPILPVLEQLKADPSPYVRKSVANNLNDISKTHPDLVLELAQRWYDKHPHTDWIVKHGCRTLLKAGNRGALSIFGFGDETSVEVKGFSLEASYLSIGQALCFSFTITANKAARVRLEYGIDYVKANGKQSRKIFQISELSLQQNSVRSYTKAHSFADVSTRKHYPGTHTLTLIVNGAARGRLDFEVLASK